MYKFSKQKIKWIKKNMWKMLLASIVVAILFACYALFHNILFDILAIVLGFTSIIYFRYKLQVFLEDDEYRE